MHVTHPAIVLLGWTALPALFVLVLVWIATAPISKWKLRKVPGRWGQIGLGNLPEFAPHTDISVWVSQQCLKYPVAFQMWLGANYYVVVSSPEMGRRLMQRSKTRTPMADMTSLPGEDYKIWNSGLFYLRGPKWPVVRRAFESAVMNPRNLAAQAPNVARCAERLCAQLQRCAESGAPTDVLPMVQSMAMDAVAFAAFGLDLQATNACLDDQQEPGPPRGRWWEREALGSPAWSRSFVRCAVGVMTGMSFKEHSIYQKLPLFFPDLFPVLHKVSEWLPDAKLVQHSLYFEGLRQGCKAIIRTWQEKQRGADKGSLVSDDGFLARLLRVMEDSEAEVQLTEVDVVGNAIFMVAAGYETTAASMSSALHLLSKNLGAQQRLQAELDEVLAGRAVTPEDMEKLPYLRAVFQEALRINTPAVAAVRVADAPLDLGEGITVPKGTRLWFPLATYMMDPGVWPQAEQFLPERHLPRLDTTGAGNASNASLAPSTDAAMMPFGHGPRMCVGYKFALLEAHLGLARLLQRFSFRQVPGTPDPKWTTSLATSPDKIVLSVHKR